MSPWHTYEQVRKRLGSGRLTLELVGEDHAGFNGEPHTIRLEWQPGIAGRIRYDLSLDQFQRSTWGLASDIAHDMRAEWERSR